MRTPARHQSFCLVLVLAWGCTAAAAQEAPATNTNTIARVSPRLKAAALVGLPGYDSRPIEAADVMPAETALEVVTLPAVSVSVAPLRRQDVEFEPPRETWIDQLLPGTGVKTIQRGNKEINIQQVLFVPVLIDIKF